jgi:hypothetical protein
MHLIGTFPTAKCGLECQNVGWIADYLAVPYGADNPVLVHGTY